MILKKYITPLFNTRAAGLYMILFATTIGVATFIENDYGTSSAQKVVFKSLWFELLLLLFSITILVNIAKYRMIQQKKWALLLFHSSIIIILIGSAATRYLGYEGVMHIRENDSSNSILSSDTYLQFEVIKKDAKYEFDEKVHFATLGNNNWKESYQVVNDLIDIEVKEFIPNPKQNLVVDNEGPAIIKIVIAGVNGREEYFVSKGSSRKIRNVVYNFRDTDVDGAVNIKYEDESLLIKYDQTLSQMVMATRQVDTLFPSNQYYPLKLRSMYSDGQNSFVFGDFMKNGRVEIISESPKVKNESMTTLRMEVTINGQKQETFVYGKKGLPGRPSVLRSDRMSMAISYGAKSIELPFSLKLYDFIMEKYPGTNSASSYASEVQLIDDRKNLKKDFRIYMNHILDYGGFRFFQSSFDQDERGTYLSVNHDFIGTWISYIGYFLLTLGLILSLFSKNSRFYQVSQKIKKMRANRNALLTIFILCIMCSGLMSQKVIAPVITEKIDKTHAEQFSQLVIQDLKGRMKPVHTLTREVMRKIARKESLHGLTADQIVLGMFANNRAWHGLPLIKVGKHSDLLELIGINVERAAYRDFYNTDGSYKLRDAVRRAYSLQPIDRGMFEKELMKVDERVNIASMVFSGRILKVIPIPGDETNTWAANGTGRRQLNQQTPSVSEKFFSSYQNELAKASQSGNYSLANQIVKELGAYQVEHGGQILPSKTRISAEILLNQLNVFNRLAVLYALLGIAFLVLLFTSVFNPKLNLSKIYKVLFILVVLGFVYHTIGLGLRWYVSGRAPWSNGYESMIYIAWTTTLAGLIFTRKSLGGLAATMILAATVLLVASLSYLDPEITPLVPVLRSYWLTIHVSLEAGSYGFLMLGAIIGLINLILMIFLSERNKEQIYRMVKEMSYISEMTLIGGLIMVSVGTYLGGIWANESWGRYWGWDAKETWALVTILVYAFILHMRLIPKLQSLYAYNLASLFGWASVIMTYYGVNYYLSGLHSYAAGDPIPIPSWVYIAIAVVVIISATAFWRKRKFDIF